MIVDERRTAARKLLFSAVATVHGAVTAWASSVLCGASDADMERLTRGLYLAIDQMAHAADLLRKEGA